jgi:hypothetical protein
MDAFDNTGLQLAFGLVLPLGLLVLVVLVLSGGRDLDPTGKRTFTLYVSIVSFVAVFVALIASTALVDSLTEKIKDDAASEGFGDDEIDEDVFDADVGNSDVSENDRVLRGVVRSGLVLAISVGVLVFHVRRRRDYRSDAEFDGSPSWRADRAFLYSVCLTSVLVVLFAAGFGSFEIFRLAAPGVFGEGDDDTVRRSALQALLTLGWLSAVAACIFRYYWLQAHPPPTTAAPGR